MFGKHNIKHWSKTQATIARSSGEDELHGIAAGIAQAMGLRSLCKDLGFNVDIRVHSDATAAIGIARRRGMGKIRHLDTTDLWIQERVRSKDVELVTVLGSENPADALAKYVDAGILNSTMNRLGLKNTSGISAAAPGAMGLKAN